MICHLPDPFPISDVMFILASLPETADGFLGGLTCVLDDALRLAPMRVRLLHDGLIRIKVRRGGIHLYAGSLSLDDERLQEVHELIEAAPEFQAGRAAIGMETGGHD